MDQSAAAENVTHSLKSKRSAPKSWGPFAATIWAIIIYLVPQFIVGIILSIYPYFNHWSSSKINNWLTNSIPAQFVFTIIIEAIALFIVWQVIRHYKATARTIGLLRPRIMDIPFALIGFAVYFGGLIAITALVKAAIPALNLNQQQDVGFQSATSVLQLLMAFISLVIIPPFAEEIIFRGFVFKGFRRKFGFIIATLGTSLLFAIPHLLESTGGGPLWIAGIDTFILSFVLCFLREKTGRLVPGMFVHALKNCVAFSYLFIFHVH